MEREERKEEKGGEDLLVSLTHTPARERRKRGEEERRT